MCKGYITAVFSPWNIGIYSSQSSPLLKKEKKNKLTHGEQWACRVNGISTHMKSECAFALCPCGAHCWLCLHVFGHVPLMRTATCNSRPRGFTLSRANSVYSCPFETINTLSVSLWHANDIGRLKHKNRVSCLLTATLTWLFKPPDGVLLMRFPPQKWLSWMGTKRGSHPKDDTRRGTLFRYRILPKTRLTGWKAVHSAESVERNVGFMINGKGSLCLTFYCALVLSLLVFLSSLRCLDPYFFLYVQYFSLCFPLFCFLFHNFA